MKKINILALLLVFSMFTSGYSKHIAIKYNDFNVLFSGVMVSDKSGQPVLTVKSLSSGVVCTGEPQVTEIMALYFLNPSYNGIFGKSYLSCNDGTKLFVNWKRNMMINRPNGSAEDAYGHKMSFYISNSASKVNDKIQQYKKDIASKPVLKNYRTNILYDIPPALIKEEVAPQKVTPIADVKKQPQSKEIPAVLNKEEKVEMKNVVNKIEKPVVKKDSSVVKNVTKPQVKNVAVEVTTEKKVIAKPVEKIVEPEKKIVPVKVEKVVEPVKQEIKNEIPVSNDKIIDIKSEVKNNPQPSVTPKEVVTTFHSDKHAEVSDLKKFNSPVNQEDKLKAINETSPISQSSNVFSMKNLLLKFTFGYNVANPAQKF